MNKFFNALLLFIPLAVVGDFLNWSGAAVFLLSAIAIIPLAKLLGDATEELSAYTGPALGGLLNATFGNATEIIISIFAIRAGLLEVVKASLTGAIIGNLLLVGGMAMLAGGFKRKKQEFNRTAAVASSATLLLAVIALVIPAMFYQTAEHVDQQTILQLSVMVSVIMILFYVASLVFALYTHKHLYTEELVHYIARWSKKKSVAVLTVCALLVGWMSEILVRAIEPTVEVFGWSELFIGVIFVAIIGNAAEHMSAVTIALKNRMDLSLQISIGSATQAAMFAAPLLVLASLVLGNPMDLVFTTFELIAIMLSVLITNLAVGDGESHWLKGLQLLMAYFIMAVAFFFY